MKRMKAFAFTLVELLVVITIISILTTILLPALKKVRERGHETTCKSTERQLYLACTMYVDDYGGWLPVVWDGVTWGAKLTKGGYFPPRKGTLAGTTLSAPLCPVKGLFGNNTYGINNSKINTTAQGFTNGSNQFSKLSQKSEIVLIADCSNTALNSWHITSGSGDSRWDPRHNGGGNVSFVDGHAKWMQAIQVPTWPNNWNPIAY